MDKTPGPILEVQDLTIALPAGGDRSTAVRKVSFSVGLPGEAGKLLVRRQPKP